MRKVCAGWYKCLDCGATFHVSDPPEVEDDEEFTCIDCGSEKLITPGEELEKWPCI